jgi:hypothetical protein
MDLYFNDGCIYKPMKGRKMEANDTYVKLMTNDDFSFFLVPIGLIRYNVPIKEKN